MLTTFRADAPVCGPVELEDRATLQPGLLKIHNGPALREMILRGDANLVERVLKQKIIVKRDEGIYAGFLQIRVIQKSTSEPSEVMVRISREHVIRVAVRFIKV